MKKTKIMALADIHGDSTFAKKVAKKAEEENVDLIIIAGDFTWASQPTKDIISPFMKHKKPILAIHGNHDPETMSGELEQVYKGFIDLHMKNHIQDKIGFFGSGTTDWGFYEDEKQVYKELNKAHINIKDLKKKIMIAHCPPQGSKIELLGFPGSGGVRRAIDKFKPDILICGHIHEGGGLIEQIGKTKVMNVARKPAIFEI